MCTWRGVRLVPGEQKTVILWSSFQSGVCGSVNVNLGDGMQPGSGDCMKIGFVNVTESNNVCFNMCVQTKKCTVCDFLLYIIA